MPWPGPQAARVQVDLIICFDASASPIRNIQRIGRTGRHRAGRVLYILAAGKEMDNYFRNQEVRLSGWHLLSWYLSGAATLPLRMRGRTLCLVVSSGAQLWCMQLPGRTLQDSAWLPVLPRGP